MLAALSRSAALRLRAPPPASSVLHARGVVARFSSSTPEGSATPNPAASDQGESKAEDASQDNAKGVAEEKGLSEVEQLSERIATLESEAEKKHDQLLRALAEADNSRRRAAIDVANSKKFAVEKFAKSLLEVADNLHRAAESVPEEARKSDEQPILASLYDGVTMTEAVLHKVFEQNGADVMLRSACLYPCDPSFTVDLASARE